MLVFEDSRQLPKRISGGVVTPLPNVVENPLARKKLLVMLAACAPPTKKRLEGCLQPLIFKQWQR